MTSIFILLSALLFVACLVMYAVLRIMNMSDDEETDTTHLVLTATTAEILSKFPPPPVPSTEKVLLVRAETDDSDRYRGYSNVTVATQVDSTDTLDVSNDHVIDPDEEPQRTFTYVEATQNAVRINDENTNSANNSRMKIPALAKSASISTLVPKKAKSSKYTLQYQENLLKQKALSEARFHTSYQIATTPTLLRAKSRFLKLK
jgi:hypothetical protein